MINPMLNIFRGVFRKKDEPLNILTFPTHERYETGLCMTGHNFYAFRAEGIKDWNKNYGAIPKNYHLLDSEKKLEQIPSYVGFDLILSQNKFGQFQHAKPIADMMGVPLISLEHTLPVPSWPPAMREQLRNMRGDINIFISEYSIAEWGFQNVPNVTVIRHMVDTNLFKPTPKEGIRIPRNISILSVVNDWINRDWCCNFSGWQRITKNLPVKVVGDTPGLSKPAPSIQALVNEYQTSRIFLNTSTISPVPTSLLEAMACGCACVSTSTCMIPLEVIEHGINGLISNNEKELRGFCEDLIKDEKLAQTLGENARKTIVEKFNEDRFILEWNKIFQLLI